MSGFMYQGHACAGNDGKGSTGNPGHNSNELTYAYTNKYRHKHKYTVLIKYTKLWMTHNTYNSSKFYLSPLHFLLSSSPPTKRNTYTKYFKVIVMTTQPLGQPLKSYLLEITDTEQEKV